jgi:hypothetical protein
MLLGDSGQLNSPNADLWTLMADDVHGVCNVQTTKVAAHQEGCVATTPIEELGFLHTQLAVRVDARANERRGPDFWSLLARYTGACRIADEWNAMIQHVLRPGSCRILMHTGMVTSLFPRCCYGCGLQWRLGKVLRSGFLMLNGLLIMLFRLGMLARFMPGDGKSVLSTHYMPCSTGFMQRARWFGKVLRATLRHAGISESSQYCRPASHMACKFDRCLALPWCAQS